MTRIKHLQGQLSKLYLDAFLITDSKNIEYLTGFSLITGDGVLLITEDQAIMVTDARYELALAEYNSNEVVGLITADYYGSLNELCQKMQIQVLGFESSISYQVYDLLDETMMADLVPFNNLIEEQRSVKDAVEIDKLQRSADLMSVGYQYVLDMIKPGMTEQHVANCLDFWMKEHGATAASFPPIVASGPNSAKPHATVSSRQIQDGDIIILDFGYYVNGYTADMTRTFAIGSIDPELRDIYHIVNEARQRVINHAMAGIHGDKLDYHGRSIINEAGYGDKFNHGMGHGIGLDVHELPATYGPVTRQLKLVANQVITVEPGIYIPHFGGVRIEDDIVITHAGPRVLTNAPTELKIVRN
ncbi:Xaa-Pro peptidase family protein [uncultured Limosilactobacillus sp.]|uniref:M24 family metallopeptidase n=1 Tax=uncultured Limosilactobacillus sp. TaxID=2837629 RepID=UPI0025E60599|nr:aminopeptidase P family protein [uncultured Limosilactobacillus sp.]